MKKIILVTGGAGFIGSHLCEKLLSLGHKVCALDNFTTGNRSNISHLEFNPLFSIMEHDVSYPIPWKGELNQIYNMACPASPIHYQKDPIFTLKTCVLGAINILELSRKANARVLQASTSEVYGDPTVNPQTESYLGNVNTVGPRSCYDEGKRCAETLFYNYHHVHKVNIQIARIFNTYGPKMERNDGRVISNLIIQAIENENLTINGDGSQSRSFCYVSDLTGGLISLMETDHPFLGPINLGRPEEITVRELALLILNILGKSGSFKHNPLPFDDPRQRCPDIQKAKDILLWHPTTRLADGLRKTIDYYLSGHSFKYKNN